VMPASGLGARILHCTIGAILQQRTDLAGPHLCRRLTTARKPSPGADWRAMHKL